MPKPNDEKIPHFETIGGFHIYVTSHREDAELVSELIQARNEGDIDPIAEFITGMLESRRHRNLSPDWFLKQVASLHLNLEGLRTQMESWRKLTERYPELLAEPAHATRPAEAE